MPCLYVPHRRLLFQSLMNMAENSCMTPQGFNENSRLRASDADRDRAASVINNALAEGRLTAEEHSERLDAIYAAKTHGELVPVLDDLPAVGAAATPASAAGRQPTPARRSSRVVAILGGASRKGVWQPEPVMHVVTVLGGFELDFREAMLPGNEIVLYVTTVLGGGQITVPPEMRVIDNGVAILGGRQVAGDSQESAAPGAPVLRIEGASVLGGIEVERKARKGDPPLSRNGAGLGGDLSAPDVLRQVRHQRHEAHRLVHEQRRAAHEQIRRQRRELRGGWTGDD
jgi:Domain of unknown function (DUF1707)/Cell wall-active antibiotics response 4TMS YvqF